MPATLRIVSWKASNLRCPDHEVNFCDDDGRPYQVSLLQMPNGTGKTTTLMLLRAALSGSADNNSWTPEKVREFGRRGGSNNGRFEVVLLLNGNRATFIMNFDFESGKVTYQTTFGEGQTNRFAPPGEFKRFLNENFVSFYVFDGELAQNLLSREHTDAETVVEQLFQVGTLHTLAGKVDEYWHQRTQGSGAVEQRGLARRQNRLRELKTRRSKLDVEKRALESKLKGLQTQHDHQFAAYNESIAKEAGVAKRRDDAKAEVARIGGEVSSESRSVLDLITQPQALSSSFAEAIYDLKISLDRVKLPDSAAREFFAELAEEEECICGRCIDDEVRTVIQARAERYLGSDDVSLLNSMKTAIDDAVGRSRTEPNESLEKRVTRLTEVVTSQREAKDELSEIELEAENSDPAVQKAKEALENLDAEIGQVTLSLQQFDSLDESQNDENTFGLAILDRRINEAEEKENNIKMNKHESTNATELFIPVIRAKMGDWWFYAGTLTLGEVAERVKHIGEINEEETFKSQLRRSTIEGHSQQVADYLLEQPQHFLGAIILGLFPGESDWLPLTVSRNLAQPEVTLPERIESAFGVIYLSGDEEIFPIDGQLRVEAIKLALANDQAGELQHEEQAVIIVAHKPNEQGRERTQRLFTSLNQR